MGWDDWLDAGALLEHGARHRWDDGATSTLEVIDACRVDFPSGRIVAVDPAYINSFDESRPVVAEVAPGQYPLVLSVVSGRASFGPFRRLTAATLRISQAQVERWDWVARTGGQVLGMGVDAGTGCFYDASNRPWLAAHQDNQEFIDAHLVRASEEGHSAVVDEAGTTVAAFFACGMGDGFYPVRVGRDAGGGIAMVMIDLELLNHSSGRVDAEA